MCKRWVRKLECFQSLILLEDVDIEKSKAKKEIYEYFIGYKDDDHNIISLRIMFPKTKWMYFFLKMMNH